MGLKKYFFRKKDKEKEEDNPFTKPTEKVKEHDKTSFRYYVKGLFSGFSHGVDRRFDVLAGRKIHVRLLRQSKRLMAAIYLFVFLALTFATLNNPFFFFFFAGTCFLLLDYLWKSRKMAWEKKKE